MGNVTLWEFKLCPYKTKSLQILKTKVPFYQGMDRFWKGKLRSRLYAQSLHPELFNYLRLMCQMYCESCRFLQYLSHLMWFGTEGQIICSILISRTNESILITMQIYIKALMYNTGKHLSCAWFNVVLYRNLHIMHAK